jgi:ribosomal protein S18 acetylase RimI-like enzyme
MSVNIANAHSADLPEIERIAELAYSELKDTVSEELWQKWIGGVIESIQSGIGTLILLKENASICGVIQFYDNAAESELDGWPDDDKAGALRVFAVLPEHHGKGYGTMLIKECIKRAKALSLKKIFLHTGYINEAAIHVFEKIGFKRIPDFDFWPYDQRIHKAIAYCLDL